MTFIRIVIALSINITLMAGGSLAVITDVAGTLSDGNSITVSGSDFGSHLDYSSATASILARAWHNAEGGTVLTDDWYYDSPTYAADWAVLSAGNRTDRSSYYLRKEDSAGGAGITPISVLQNDDYSTWFSSFWVQIGSGCDESGSQGKLLRLWADTNYNVYYSPYGETNRILWYYENTGEAVHWPSGASGLGFDTWHRIDVLMTKADETTTVYIDGIAVETDTVGPLSGFNGGGHSWDLGTMTEGTAGVCYHHFDDVYFNPTQARVELCPGSSWSSRGACEIQPVSSWADTVIEFPFNQGQFNSNETAYIYVVDSTGAANSNGYEVTVGGTPEETEPSNTGSCFGTCQ